MATVPDRIYFKDRHSHITRANHAHAFQFGLSDPAEEIGKTDFDFISEEIARIKYDQEQEIIRTGQPLIGLEEPDAQGGWALTTKMPLRDEHGEMIGTSLCRNSRAEQSIEGGKSALLSEIFTCWRAIRSL
jgi:PAS domain-containing protein